MRLTNVRLLTDDIDRAVAFYRDVLGLEVATDAGVYVEFRWEGVALGLYRRELADQVIGAEHRPLPQGRPDGAIVSLEVDDVDAAHDRLARAGVTFVKDPHDQEAWFMRVGYLRDPDGHLIELYEPTHEGMDGAGG